MSLYFALLTVENNKNKKSVKFQGDMLNFCDFIQVFVFTTNHHLNPLSYRDSVLSTGTNKPEQTLQTQIRLFPQEQSDLDLHCLFRLTEQSDQAPHCLHLSDTLLHSEIKLFQLEDSFGNCFKCPKCLKFYGRRSKYFAKGDNIHDVLCKM